MNHEFDNSPNESSESSVRSIGRGVLYMVGAYPFLKGGEYLTGLTLPYAVEMGISYVLGRTVEAVVTAKR